METKPNYVRHFKTLRGIVFCLVLVISSSCKKKEIQGPKGDPGASGTGGNVNISNSSVIQVDFTQWKQFSNPYSWQTTLSSTLITAAVVEKGSVSVFVQDGPGWKELPFILGDLSTQFGFKEGSITLLKTNIHGSLPDQPVTENYRLVVLSQSARPARLNEKPKATALTETSTNQSEQ